MEVWGLGSRLTTTAAASATTITVAFTLITIIVFLKSKLARLASVKMRVSGLKAFRL